MKIISENHVSRIRRVDDEKRVVMGEVYAPNTLDTYGEMMTARDVEDIAHRYMQINLAASIDLQHNNKPQDAYPVESFIARECDSEFTPGSWVLAVKIENEELWRQVKRGIYNGFSLEALVYKVPAEVEYDMQVDNFGLTEKVDDHTHLFWASLDDAGVINKGMTSRDNGHSHTIMRGSATEIAEGHSHRFMVA